MAAKKKTKTSKKKTGKKKVKTGGVVPKGTKFANSESGSETVWPLSLALRLPDKFNAGPGQHDSTIPRAALEFGVKLTFDPAGFADVESEGEGGDEQSASAKGEHRTAPFRGTVNSGGIILGHPWWGNFAIDMEGLRIPTEVQPVLRDHDVGKILGMTSKISVTEDKGLEAVGELLDITQDGDEVMKLAEAGFPFQMSGYFPPKQILQVEEGESVEVNGHTLNGPGHIFKVAELLEVTITPLGADSNTSVALLSRGQRQNLEVETHSILVSKLSQPTKVAMTDTDQVPDGITTADAETMAQTAATEARKDERARLTLIDQHAANSGLTPERLAEMKASDITAEEAAVEILGVMKASGKGAALRALSNGPAPLNDESTFTEPDDKPIPDASKAEKLKKLLTMPESIDDGSRNGKPNEAKFELEYELNVDEVANDMPQDEYLAYRRNTPRRA